jgi:predicted RNase H-like HicB family nuclease
MESVDKKVPERNVLKKPPAGMSVANLSVRLEAAFRKKGGSWLAWCVPLDVMTQAETKEAAFESLKEAVGLWFESCVERRVLDEALAEVGFRPIRPGECVPANASIVEVNKPSRAIRDNFTASEDFEVLIPAYIAAKQLEPSATC